MQHEVGHVQLLTGDTLKTLCLLPSASVQCVVTSPPYYGLRDYGDVGQIGLEETPAVYIERLVAVFREMRRVLRKDGVFWLNVGDSYSGYKGAKYAQSGYRGTGEGSHVPRQHNIGTPHTSGLANKQLLGIPWRLALALQADGWILRSDIIWHKPNCMPESVKDRPTKAHEYLFLLAKSERYYYAADAIREPAHNWGMRDRARGKYTSGIVPISGGAHHGLTNGNNEATGRNKRSVWTVSTQSYDEVHFATFPPKLIEPCILAGSRPGDIVLDPFIGSGTTALVASQHGRCAIGIDLNPTYIALAEKRLGQTVLVQQDASEKVRNVNGTSPDTNGTPPSVRVVR